ncbi:MAG TPA: S53 family peptidase [Jatrophihabitantaceae bacterium]|nr:S53 family peptidase [Jatrophihabitantaceae bacterium]
MEKRTAVRVATSALAVSALAAGCLAAAPGAGAQPSRHAVANSKPTWLPRASHLGAAPKSAPVQLRVYLAPNGGQDALKAAVDAVSTPSSPEYRQFLSTAAYNRLFAPTSAAVTNVTSWLKGSGLSVTGVEAHNRYISVTGSVATAQKAFGVSIQRYQHDGQSVTAPSSVASVPAGVAGSVLSVSGLDSTVKKVAHTAKAAPPPPGFVNARPCSLSYGQVQAKYQADFHTPLPKYNGKVIPYSPCGYTGPQFRSAYEGDTDLDGTGVTVAITDAYAAPTIAKDATTYAANHGDAAYAPGQLTQSVPKKFTHEADCNPSGWYGEETLDVEAVHAMASGANIKYYASASCYDADFLDTLAKVVDDNQAQLVSNSWSDLEANESADNIAAYEQVFLQGALQGISFLYSSGDNGDELASSGLKQVDYPASDPYVTAVGGTSTAIGADGTLAWQTGWGTQKYTLSADGKSWAPVGFLYGAGGGYSALFNRPDYQNGVVPDTAPPGRAVPDVGLDADPTTGMLIGETQTFPNGVRYGEYRIGGTSLAAPLFAGMTALTLQNAGGGIGLLNPTIYSQANSGTFTDVKGTPKDAGNVRADYTNGVDPSGGQLYSVRTFNQDSSLKVTTGWDDVTGLGAPNADWLTSVSPL